MSKITNSIIFIAVLAVLAFIPAVRAEATYTYIGIQIDTVKRLSTMEDTCLKPNTVMSIMAGAIVLDTVTTTTTIGPTASPTSCSNNKIWSELIDLPDGTYNIKIETPICWGYWSKNSGYNRTYRCWYAGTRYGSKAGGDLGHGESCLEVCADHVLDYSDTGYTPTYITASIDRWDENMVALKSLTGNTCSNPQGGCTYASPSVDIYNNYCFYCVDCQAGCADGGSNQHDMYARICACSYPTGIYNFPFTFAAP